MEFKEIYQSINSISPVSIEAWTDFLPLVESMELKKNDYLVKEGSNVNHCFMLIAGVIRVYFSKDGNEYNKTFFIPGMFPTPLTALLSEAPSELYFQALVSCRLIRFSYHKFKQLFDRHRCFEQLFLRILEREWINKEKHDIHMVTNDATTNYMIFREKYPNLENLIPQYHIASYLGITPIQLSRIRTRLLKNT
ncbi:MAG: Crp/Fnr family transcriptional regulator [Chloroflexia bacterium]|nr:Crp/Fnr family transcriptional regulator [Chloroflexia bacterium]